MKWIVATALVIVAGLFAWAHWPTRALPQGMTADRIVVLKSARTLDLYRNDVLLKRYSISLGLQPVGAKQREGDRRTPEGRYHIDFRKADSGYHRALHISYPSREDRMRAAREGVAPGGAVMIHGMRNGFGWIGRAHRWFDWTHGCVAMTNAELDELWRAVPDGTPIELRP
jgi:murein L,D-transpeptidase YafK